MSDVQSAEPQAPLGEPAGGASAPVVTESSGTTASTTDTPSTTTAETQTSQPPESPVQSTTSEAGTAGDAGNDAGQAASADSAMPTGDAPLLPVTADAVATFADLMDQFESRQYPNGVMLRTVGELPSESPVSYPTPTTPSDDSPHGLLNQIEAYFTTALRSSRTDGHKLIAQLRATLSADE